MTLRFLGPAAADISTPAENQTPFIQTAEVTVANSTAEATLVGAGNGSVTLAAADLVVGAKFGVKFQGIISDTGNPGFQMRGKLGGVLLGDTGVNGLGIGTNDHWIFDMEFVVVTEGATGTVRASGGFFTSAGDHIAMINVADITIDTTAAQAVDVTGQWAVANVANTVTCQIAEIHRFTA